MKKSRTQKQKKAFSMIELLVVVAVIAILATVMIPAINKIARMGRESGLQAFLTSVAQAARAYSKDNDDVYPGQDIPDQLGSYNLNDASDPDDDVYTANQVLAARIFGYQLTDIGTSAPKADTETSYLAYKAEYLESVNSSPNTLVDGSGKADDGQYVALLYFPSRGEFEDSEVCYIPADCGSYITSARLDTTVLEGENAEDVFYGKTDKSNHDPNNLQTGEVNAKLDEYYARDKRMQDNSLSTHAAKLATGARNQGEFLLFGAGLDQKYFTEDDLKSWK